MYPGVDKLQGNPAYARSLFRDAVFRGRTQEVSLLLPFVDPAEPWERYRITPLMLAAMEQHIEIISILAMIGDANRQDTYKGMNALMWSITQKDEPSARFLAEFTDLKATDSASRTAVDLAMVAGLGGLAQDLRCLARSRAERACIAAACGVSDGGNGRASRL